MDDLRELAERKEAMSPPGRHDRAGMERAAFIGCADRGGVVATVDAAGTLVALEVSSLSKRRNDGSDARGRGGRAVHAAEQVAAEAKEAMMRELEAAAGPHLGGLLGDAQRSFEARANREPE